MGIIIISDDVAEVINTCNKIAVMKKGRMVKMFTNKEINEEQLALQLS